MQKLPLGRSETNQKPVLKTSSVGPNSLFKIRKERVRSDLKRLKNRLRARRHTRAHTHAAAAGRAEAVRSTYVQLTGFPMIDLTKRA